MNTPKKILLIQLMSNGDCLYATAVARQIKKDYPGCHLTWAIASFCKGIIDNNPYVDAVWEVPNVSATDRTAMSREVRKEAALKKSRGEIDDIFFTQIIDENLANYDGCIRSSIFRGYDRSITVPVKPVLRLREEEIAKAKTFAIANKLADFRNVILFEFAPQSGQIAMTPSLAINIASEIVKNDQTVIILSSNLKIEDSNEQIIDGSKLTLRETAALTHYCTLLLGCSSGITWISTSDAAKELPMVQLLDPYAYWVNPISRDFERCGFSTEQVLEIYDHEPSKIVSYVNEVLNAGFAEAKKKFQVPLPLQFKTTSRSIYNMLCFLQFRAIIKHIRINVSVFGWHPLLIKAIITGFVTAPFKLLSNVINKRLRKSKS